MVKSPLLMSKLVGDHSCITLGASWRLYPLGTYKRHPFDEM